MMLPSFTLNDIRLLPIQKCGVLPDCHGLDAHLVTVENFHNCSGGGTTALHAYRVWGAVILVTKSDAFGSPLPRGARMAARRKSNRRRVYLCVEKASVTIA